MGRGRSQSDHPGRDKMGAEMRSLKKWGRSLLASALMLPALAGIAWAEPGTIQGAPRDWQLGFQPPATPVMHQLEGFHNDILLPVTFAISIFVLLLLIYIMVRYNVRANPVPSKTTHNTLIEVIWTLLPVAILVVIAIPSFKLLFAETRIPNPDLTIKVTGHAWNWEYEYPDQNDFSFTAVVKQEADLLPGELRLLATDHKVVVPVNANVHVLVTGADVIHSWAVPAFGIKIDAIPGRANETWFRAEREGIYFGECSELCGKDHSAMPIEIHVVSAELFKSWAAAAGKDIGDGDKLLAEAEQAGGTKVAAARAPAALAQ
jgi:cytochrome c oxidase subunit 2